MGNSGCGKVCVITQLPLATPHPLAPDLPVDSLLGPNIPRGLCSGFCPPSGPDDSTVDQGLVPSVFESYVADEEVDGQHVELALWDTAVQEECYCLSYSSSHVILVCFAIDSPDSLGNVQAKVSSRSLITPLLRLDSSTVDF